MVLRLDPADRRLAARIRLVRPRDYSFFLLPVLGRATFRFAVARRTVDARAHHRASSGGDDHAFCAKAAGAGSWLMASRKSSGGAA